MGNIHDIVVVHLEWYCTICHCCFVSRWSSQAGDPVKSRVGAEEDISVDSRPLRCLCQRSDELIHWWCNTPCSQQGTSCILYKNNIFLKFYDTYKMYTDLYFCDSSVRVSFLMSCGWPSNSVTSLESLVRNCSIFCSPSGRWPSSHMLVWWNNGWPLELSTTEAKSSASHGENNC